MLKGHAGGVRAVNFSPDGRLLMSASDDKAVKARARDARKGLNAPVLWRWPWRSACWKAALHMNSRATPPIAAAAAPLAPSG